MILNFLYVCQSVSLLTSLLKLYKCRDISCSGWYIFLKFFWDIPVMLVHYFKIIFNFLYVCQSISWLMSLLKLDTYTEISSSEWDIFLISFWDIHGTFVHYFQIITIFLFLCQWASWLTSLLKLDKYRHSSGPEWDIFLKIFGDIPGMLLHHFQIILNFLYVPQSVSLLTYLLKLGLYRYVFSSE